MLVRVAVGLIGVALILAGIAVAAVAGPGGGIVAALYLFIPGVVALAAVALERTRYRSLRAEATGEAHGPGGGETGTPEPRFRPTPERFVDPTTGVAMRVWIDPASGDRRYVAET